MAIPRTKLWPLEPHTIGKHLVLKNYLDAWLPVLGTWQGRILFVDGFSGPGEYQGGEDGSPIIAMRRFIEHDSRSKITAEVFFMFIEKEEDRAEHLESVVAKLRPHLPSRSKAYVLTGQFDETLKAVLDRLDEQEQRLAPAFVMIDPFGVSGTPMSVIGRILKNPRCEVYVSFMYESINRFKTTKEFAPHLDDLFGTEDWKEGLCITDPEARKRFFYDLYKKQLKKHGAREVVRFELYEGDRIIYAIFHASRHPKACDLMKKAIWKVSPFGDYAFRGTRSSQLRLGLTSADCSPLERALSKEFKGDGWVSIEEILEFARSDRTDYHSGHVKRAVLARMETEGKIRVKSGSRKRARTYPGGTQLRFV
jgi:three-Cys-motif partner protein